MICEKCLYRKNCQFLLKHKKAVVAGCTSFYSEEDLRKEAAREIFDAIDKIIYKYLDDKDYSDGEMVYDINQIKDRYVGE